MKSSIIYRIRISKFALKLDWQKLTRSNRGNRYSSSTGHHGDFLEGIIWRLSNSAL